MPRVYHNVYPRTRIRLFLLPYLDCRAVADAGLLDLQRRDHARLVPQVVLARSELLREKRLRQGLEPFFVDMDARRHTARPPTQDKRKNVSFH